MYTTLAFLALLGAPYIYIYIYIYDISSLRVKYYLYQCLFLICPTHSTFRSTVSKFNPILLGHYISNSIYRQFDISAIRYIDDSPRKIDCVVVCWPFLWWCRGEPLPDEETLLGARAGRGAGRGKSSLAHGGTEIGTVCESEDDDLLQDHQVGQVSANCSS